MKLFEKTLPTPHGEIAILITFPIILTPLIVGKNPSLTQEQDCAEKQASSVVIKKTMSMRATIDFDVELHFDTVDLTNISDDAKEAVILNSVAEFEDECLGKNERYNTLQFAFLEKLGYQPRVNLA